MKKQSIQERIKGLNLDNVKVRFMRKQKVSQEAADQTAELYRQYLELSHTNPNAKLVPTELVDEFWHTHILDTAQYQKDCDALFGGYFHHDPNYYGTEEFDKSWKETKKLYNTVGTDLVGATKKAVEAAYCGGGMHRPEAKEAAYCGGGMHRPEAKEAAYCGGGMHRPEAKEAAYCGGGMHRPEAKEAAYCGGGMHRPEAKEAAYCGGGMHRPEAKEAAYCGGGMHRPEDNETTSAAV